MTTPTLTPTAVKTGHVGLNVTDLGRSQDFYRQVLGLEALVDGRDGDREWAFLGGIFFTDPDGIRLEVYPPAGLAGHAAPPVGEAPTRGFF